jgi:hypothetical protein
MTLSNFFPSQFFAASTANVLGFFLRFNKDFTSRDLQNLTLSTSTFNGLSCSLGKGMSLNSNALAHEFFSTNHNLVYIVLGLGNSLRF